MLSNQFRHVYQFRIVLKDTKPPIWRRIQVPDNYSFKDLHVAIQNVMDWEVYAGSSYEFRIARPSKGLVETIACSCFGFSQYAGTHEPLKRIADYFSPRNPKASYSSKHKSNWDFTIELEEILVADKFEKYPICIKGKRASPPEDCGGANKYQEILKTISESSSRSSGKALKLYQGVLEDDFDPNYFDRDNVFFTAGSGNPPLPDDLPERLMKIFKKL
jgi:hypothetical protein